ncbi:PASTA domain-containing protein [Ammoniphilus sp. YIM 78166]|uniref:PASTA domain-containing protein n=1 Tax=Ammoniphilus sp. YIM 78166 TaxID=1644106 RepID=UPI00106F9706|nr:PASTA domain-containing protein [Ammoniphilus sp. YIM 78166]
MIPLNERYQFSEKIFTSPSGSLFLGKDESLQRQVYLYRMEKSKISDEEHTRMMAGVSHVVHPSFFHILDMGVSKEGAFAVLEKREGISFVQLLKQKSDPYSLKEILSIAIQVGKAVQDALEERIRGYSITAENLWLYENQVMVINYWTEGEREQRGAMGLATLLYQLITRSVDVPTELERIEEEIMESPLNGSKEEKESLIRMLRRARNGQDTLSSLILSMNRLVNHATLSADFSHEEVEPTIHCTSETETTKPKRAKMFLLPTFFLLIILLAVMTRGLWFKSEETLQPPAPQEPVPVTETVNEEPEPEEAPTPEPESSPEPTTFVEVPNMVGESLQAAEKRALDQGLRYQYFLDFNERPEGEVFKQDPEPGDQVAKGSRITFWVSKGPAN